MFKSIIGCTKFKTSTRTRSRSNPVFQIELLEPRRMLAASSSGFIGTYFAAGTTAVTPAIVQNDALIDFDWGHRSPLEFDLQQHSSAERDCEPRPFVLPEFWHCSNNDAFSVRWESNLHTDHSGTFQLIVRLNHDDGVRLWLDNQLAIDAWFGAGVEELTADVDLVANESTPLRIEYRDISGAAKIWFGWTSPELPVEVVGPEWTTLSQAQQNAVDGVATRGVLHEQLAAVGGDFLTTGEVNYNDVANGSVISSMISSARSSTHPAQRTRGFVVPELSSTYQFRISGGDANRLLIADDSDSALARVVASSDSRSTPGQWNADSNQTSAAIELVAGVRYYFEARQIDKNAYDGLEVQWRRTGTNWETIPTDQLRPVQAEVGVRAVVSAVNETDASSTLSFDVSRNDDFGRSLEVNLAYGGQASRDIDYTGALSKITIPVGQRSTRVNLAVNNDLVDELKETIEVSVAKASDYALATPVRARTTLSIFGNLIPEGNSIISDAPLDLANIASISGTNYASFSNRVAQGENGGTINGTVLVVDTTTTPPNDTSVWARWNIDQNIDQSETLYAEFYYRRLGTLWSPLTFNVRTTSPFADVGRTEVTAKGFWQRAQIPIKLSNSISSSASRVEMFLGERVAKVEIANFKVLRFVDSFDDAATVLPEDGATLANTDIKAGQGTYATFSERTTTAAEQVPFNNALTVDVHTSATFLTQIRAGWYSDFAITENSLLTVEAWLRTDDAPFNVRLQVEQPLAVNRNLFKENLQATSTWTQHRFTVTALESSDLGELRLEALFGRSVGTLEIGGVQIWNHGVAPDLKQHLPRSYQSYAEREADSDWRWEAQQSVLENRRNPLTVNVTNLAGAPIPGAVVEVNQLEHAYGFGNIIKSEFVSDESGGQASTAASQRHQAIASRLFNTITIANGLRWRSWDLSEQRAHESVDWVNDNVDSLHGHHLTWGQLSFIPAADQAEYERLRNEVSQAAAREYLRTAQLAHVADIASELGGDIAGTDRPKIAHWDTVNHPVLLKEIWNILRNGGPLSDPIGEVFDVAKANSNPDTLQMINEGQTIERVGIPRRTEYYDLIEELLANGKPVEAIGFMNHFEFALAPSPTQIDAYLDEFATFGLPLGITEFDVDTNETDLQTQADWSADHYLNVFANPATSFIIGWGFWGLARGDFAAGKHWYEANWEAKPNAEVFIDQVHREWQTNTLGSTRADGVYRTMAYNGDHQVTVTVDGQQYFAIAEVDADGGIVNVAINRPVVVEHGTRVEAERYNGGGEGVAYHDTTVGNVGADYRTHENVDIGANTDEGEPGYSLGWVRGGEWLEYTADVVGGTYDVSVRVASNNANPGDLKLRVGSNGDFVDLATFSTYPTGGWNTWETLTVENVNMAAFDGFDRVFRLEMVGGNFNVNWFEFTINQQARPDVTPSATTFNDSIGIRGFLALSPFNGRSIVEPGDAFSIELYNSGDDLVFSGEIVRRRFWIESMDRVELLAGSAAIRKIQSSEILPGVQGSDRPVVGSRGIDTFFTKYESLNNELADNYFDL